MPQLHPDGSQQKHVEDPAQKLDKVKDGEYPANLPR
jgi:hypothetical protein